MLKTCVGRRIDPEAPRRLCLRPHWQRPQRASVRLCTDAADDNSLQT